MTKSPLARGPLSQSEKDFIEANAETMDPQTIADKIRRTKDVVLKRLTALKAPHLDRTPAGVRARDNDEQAIARQELRQSVAWSLLSSEFTVEELRLFEERYVALKSQFKEDVLASEESQLFKAIKAEIMMHRNLVQQKQAQEDIQTWERKRSAWEVTHEGHNPSEEEQQKYLNIEQFLRGSYAAKQSLTNEYIKLDQSHQDCLKSLKSTREQRISRVESSKLSFLDLIRQITDSENAAAEGRMMELAKKSTEKERLRLGAEHRYGDDTIDRPLLNADTVGIETDDDEDGD